MGTYTEVADPVTIVQGRPWSMAMQWQDPNGTGINIAAFTIGGVAHRGAAAPLALTFTVNDAATGQFTASLDATQTASIPQMTGASLVVSLNDSLGDTFDFKFAVKVAVL